MKALFKKDLRENFTVGVIGLGVFTLFIVMFCRTAGKGDIGNHPLLSGGLSMIAIYFCCLYGAVLGWVQSRREGNRDLWAFLIHRPITRTQIFQSKTAAGLCLYFAGAGLPLGALICYCALPGTFAVPFEPAMALPCLLLLLLGLPYYFAGLLTGLRQARWYGSRTFGFGAAFLSTMMVTSSSHFWWAFLCGSFWTLALAVAVWGAYQTGGFYRGQAGAGKTALTFSLTGGTFIVSILLMILLATLFYQSRDFRLDAYVMTDDGQLCINTVHNDLRSYTDLAGKPAQELATGRPIRADTFAAAPGVMLGTNSAATRWLENFFSTGRFYNYWNSSGETAWYLDRHGKLTGFDLKTHRHVGDITGGGERFLPSMVWQQTLDPEDRGGPYRLLAAGSTVYHLDLNNRRADPLFTVPDGPIIAFGERHFRPAGTNAIVVTRKTIKIFDLNGKTIMSAPYQPGPADYPQFQILALIDPSRYAIWFYPDTLRNEAAADPMLQRVVWLAEDGKVTRAVDLPELPPYVNRSAGDRFAVSFTPPILHLDVDHGRVRLANRSSLWPAALCALVAGFFARRYRFGPAATIAWLLFIVFCGVPALLAFFAVQEWPRRENCPNCGKPRAVDRELCEHCATDFPPPAKVGIEIFEPLTAPKANA